MKAPRPRTAALENSRRVNRVANGEAFSGSQAMYREAIREGRHSQFEICPRCFCVARAIYPLPVICPECGKTLLGRAVTVKL